MLHFLYFLFDISSYPWHLKGISQPHNIVRVDCGEGGLADCAVFSNWNRYIVVMSGHKVDFIHAIVHVLLHMDANKATSNLIIFSVDSFQYPLLCSKSKHASTAKNHIEKVVGFFSKIDPVLGKKAANAKPSEKASNGASKKNASGGKKRKNDGKDSSDSSPKKKATGNNGSLSLSQREKRAMELLSSYLEECGGELEQVLTS